jgi:hypothetical protein
VNSHESRWNYANWIQQAQGGEFAAGKNSRRPHSKMLPPIQHIALLKQRFTVSPRAGKSIEQQHTSKKNDKKRAMKKPGRSQQNALLTPFSRHQHHNRFFDAQLTPNFNTLIYNGF